MLEITRNTLRLLIFSSTQSSLGPSTSLNYFFHQGISMVFMSQFTLLMNYKKTKLFQRTTITFQAWSAEKLFGVQKIATRPVRSCTCDSLFLSMKLRDFSSSYDFLVSSNVAEFQVFPLIWCQNHPEMWGQNKFGFLRNNWKPFFC